MPNADRPFPTILIGSQRFYDLLAARVISPDRYRRYATRAAVLHHTAGQSTFPDGNADGSTMDEELAHIAAIERFHVGQGFGGFGYNAIAFPSGRAYTAGDMGGARAHVAGRNGELGGFVLAGTYTNARPPLGCVLGAGRLMLALLETHGLIPLLGHREAALALSPTSCPGDGGLAIRDDVLRVAVALKAAQRGYV